MSKSDKFEKSVARASKNADDAIATADVASAQSIVMGAGLVEEFTPEEFVREMQEHGGVMAERFLTLEEGQMLRGVLVGRGDMADVESPDGKRNLVERLRFAQMTKQWQPTGAVVSILSSTQLATAFNGVKADGTTGALIAKGGKRQTNRKRVMDEYFVQLFRGIARLNVAELASPEPTPALPAPAQESVGG